MTDSTDQRNPSLRADLELMPVQGQDGNTMIVLRDPLGLDERGPLAMSAGALPLLQLLDGDHSPEQIRLELVQQSARQGQIASIPIDVVASVIDGLDQAFLLDNERFRQARDSLVQGFTSLPERPAALAGQSYPEQRENVEEFLEDMLASADGGGAREELEGREIVALVAPHIELNVGEKVYAPAYSLLRGRSYDRVIILGVGHAMPGGLLSITDKAYTTPLGTAATDGIAATRLRKAAGELAAPDDFDHRSEHSIEFQLLFLQHLLEGPFTIVPVLCGSLYGDLIMGESARPRELEPALPVLDCLAGLIADSNMRTLVVAGVDFSHIGPKFGDSEPAVQIADDAKEHDRALLDALVARDVNAFCAEGRRRMDRYHVCGFSALSMLLEMLPEGVRGRELGYRLWHETATRSAVSFASAVFYR